MTDWPVFVIGVFATSIVMAAIMAINREERLERSVAAQRREAASLKSSRSDS